MQFRKTTAIMKIHVQSQFSGIFTAKFENKFI